MTTRPLPAEELNGQLLAAVTDIVSEPVPEESLERSIQRVRAVLHDRPTPRCHNSGRLRRSWRGAVLGTVTALVMLLGVWFVRPSATWADVLAALRTRDWVHMTSVDSNGKKHELWLSPSRNVMAKRSHGVLEFLDYGKQTHFYFEQEKGVVVKVPTRESRPVSRYETLIHCLPGVLTSDANLPLDSDLSAALFAEQAETLYPKLQRIREASRVWLEVRIEKASSGSEDSVEHEIIVDATTLLPHRWTLRGESYGKNVERQITFDYPEQGPNDIFALGVSPETLVVDRSLPDDVARLVAEIEKGRRQFDNYHAIVVESSSMAPWWNGNALQVWRKGKKWRVERALQHPSTAPVQEDVARKNWWFTNAQALPFAPANMCDGRSVYRATGKVVSDADGRPTRYELQGWSPVPSDLSLPVFYAKMPEFACRPPLGIPSRNLEPVLRTPAEDGPAGTVSLELQTNGETQQRFYVDPEKHVVVQWSTDLPRLVEKVERSPKGYWYAQEIRASGSVRHGGPQNPVQDSITRFYVRFDVELPDDLFEADSN